MKAARPPIGGAEALWNWQLTDWKLAGFFTRRTRTSATASTHQHVHRGRAVVLEGSVGPDGTGLLLGFDDDARGELRLGLRVLAEVHGHAARAQRRQAGGVLRTGDLGLVVVGELHFRIGRLDGDALRGLVDVPSSPRTIVAARRAPAVPGSGGASAGQTLARFLRGWLRGEPLETSAKWANACGAFAVSRLLCSPEYPTWPELQEFLKRAAGIARFGMTRRSTISIGRRHGGPAGNAVRPRHRPPRAAGGAGRRAGTSRKRSRLSSASRSGCGSRRAGGPASACCSTRPMAARRCSRPAKHPLWIGRPVEQPGSARCASRAAPNRLAADRMAAEHTVKCLALYHPDDDPALKAEQLRRSAASTMRRAGSTASPGRDHRKPARRVADDTSRARSANSTPPASGRTGGSSSRRPRPTPGRTSSRSSRAKIPGAAASCCSGSKRLRAS